jgi:hypothetical protein
MTRIGREQLVEQFLGCEMSLDQEREFVMQVATDPELFTLLRAYRVMDRALERGSTRILSGAIPVLGIGTAGLDRLPGMAQQIASQASSSASGVSTASLVQGGTAAAFSFSTWSVTVVVALLAASAGFLVRPMVAPTGTDLAVTTSATTGVVAPPPVAVIPQAFSVPTVVTAESAPTTTRETATTGRGIEKSLRVSDEPSSKPALQIAPVSPRQASPIHQQQTAPVVPPIERASASQMDGDHTTTERVSSSAIPDTVRRSVRSADSVMIKPKFDRTSLPH